MHKKTQHMNSKNLEWKMQKQHEAVKDYRAYADFYVQKMIHPKIVEETIKQYFSKTEKHI